VFCRHGLNQLANGPAAAAERVANPALDLATGLDLETGINHLNGAATGLGYQAALESQERAAQAMDGGAAARVERDPLDLETGVNRLLLLHGEETGVNRLYGEDGQVARQARARNLGTGVNRLHGEE
jgi:hypothetical protein